MTRNELNNMFEKSMMVYVIPIGVLLMVYTIVHFIGLHRVLAADVEAIGIVITIFGSIYAVIWAFTIFLIWQQFSSVESLNMQEASSLDDVVRFARNLEDDDKLRIVSAVRNYLRSGVEQEWSELAAGRGSHKTEELFDGVIAGVFNVNPKNTKQQAFYERLLEIVEKASTFRDERVEVSTKRMPNSGLCCIQLIQGLSAPAAISVFLFISFVNL